MNRIILSIVCFILFTSANYAQYTNIINSNTPGDANTPYSVGINVLQFENSITYNKIDNQPFNYNSKTFSNDLNIHYGFLLEKLEASINHVFTHGDINNNNITSTENLSIGLKYMIYEYKNKESPKLKKSWKRRHAFKYNGLIPTVAVQFQYHTPLSDNRFNNGGENTFSLDVITQNNINKKLRINNQIGYYNFKGNNTQLVYTVSSSYVVARRWNPFVQYQFYASSDYSYSTFGLGVPFLVNRDLSVSSYFKYSAGKDIIGHQGGINISYRLDYHKDKWKKKKKSKEERKEEKKNKKKNKKRKKKERNTIDESDIEILDINTDEPEDTEDENDSDDTNDNKADLSY